MEKARIFLSEGKVLEVKVDSDFNKFLVEKFQTAQHLILPFNEKESVFIPKEKIIFLMLIKGD